MSVMEFVLVAHSIIVGLAVAEILRGFAELLRSSGVRINYRLLLIAGWTLLLLLQLWWAIWKLGEREIWAFHEFIIFLLPAGLLYMIARLCFPATLNGADLDDYYLSVSRGLWWLVALTYASFAFLMQPFVFGQIWPMIFASQIALVALALMASWIKSPAFQMFVIAAMWAQVLWRGLSDVIGKQVA